MAAPTTAPHRKSSSWRLTAQDFLHHRLGVVGLVVIVVMALFSFVGPLIYPTDQSSTNLLQINLPPSCSSPSVPTPWVTTSSDG